MCRYKWLTDLGGLIGGLCALGAGLIAYWAGQRAVAKQLATAAKRDRLQAHTIAVGVYPELSSIRCDRRDAFLGLMCAAAKLGVAFRDYLGARLSVPHQPAIPYLPDLVPVAANPPENRPRPGFVPPLLKCGPRV